MQTFEFGDKIWDKETKAFGLYIGTDLSGTPHQLRVDDRSRDKGYAVVWRTDDQIEPYKEQDKPKMRVMTQYEVLHFVTNTPGIVAKRENDNYARPANYYNYQESDLSVMVWSHASPTGEYEWKKFEVEE